MPAWLVLKNRQVFPNTEMPMFFLQIRNIMARLFLVLENLLLDCCVMYSGYGFGENALSNALSSLGATGYSTHSMQTCECGGIVMEQDERSGCSI